MHYSDLNSILSWYQQYVSTFDKEKWEWSVEEKILRGMASCKHIPKKSAKVQSELIDLDLVRGSSFPKAKPKHGVFTTTRLGLLRFLFLPVFHKWWSAQTSRKLFLVFLILYAMQVGNVFLYLNSSSSSSSLLGNKSVDDIKNNNIDGRFYGPLRDGSSSSTSNSQLAISSGIQTSEIISPILLMIALTVLHSQIVATHWQNGDKSKPMHGNKRDGRRRKESLLKCTATTASTTTITTRKRRSGRLPPSVRRRSSLHGIVPSTTTTLSHSSTSSSSTKNIRKTLRITSNCSTENVLIASAASSSSAAIMMKEGKKVIFEDESKSLSSNSDKDEGIEETLSIDNGENDDCVFDSSNSSSKQVSDSLRKDVSQIQAHVHASLDKIKSAVVILGNMQNMVQEYGNNVTGKQNNEENVSNLKLTKDSLNICHQTLNNNNSDDNNGSTSQTLRKRNVSKQSESTTSVSCGECSSNNNDSSTEEEDDDDDEEDLLGEETLEDEELRSKSEWTAVTTNSEDDGDYGDEINNSDDDDEDYDEETFETQMNDHPFAWEFQQNSSTKCSNINPSSVSTDKISCTVWEGNEAKKADLGVLDISSTIIAKVECARENSDYLYLGITFSCMIAILPCCWRLNLNFEIDHFEFSKLTQYLSDALTFSYGDNLTVRIMILISIVERLSLAVLTFFLLAVAEKTYKQRFLFAKLFERITSFRKAKKSGIPHFRLNKVRNIKTWLSVRSYLQRRGPQRSVDIIVSATFIASFILIFFFSVELLKDSNRMYYLYNVEVMAWSLALGIFLMRFMTLGSRISQKYRNLSVIITEQLNLYLKMEQKPHKKEELLVANNVLKLASELLKELEDPFKISSFASNPYLYNVTRIVILSAFSGVLSELLGFKLKLYNIKIK